MDLMTLKNDTARQNAIRETIAKAVTKALADEYGVDNVIFVDKKVTVMDGDGNETAEIASNSVVLNCGKVKAKNGDEVDAVAVINATVKSWDTKTNKSAKVTYAVRFDDIVDSIAEQKVADKNKKSEG